MELEKIINIADTAYGHGLVKQCFESPHKDCDPLAGALVCILNDNFYPRESTADQLQEIVVLLDMMIAKLMNVRNGFIGEYTGFLRKQAHYS
jgi:hypothetical protein